MPPERMRYDSTEKGKHGRGWGKKKVSGSVHGNPTVKMLRNWIDVLCLYPKVCHSHVEGNKRIGFEVWIEVGTLVKMFLERLAEYTPSLGAELHCGRPPTWWSPRKRFQRGAKG